MDVFVMPRRWFVCVVPALALSLMAGCAHQKGFRCELPPPLFLTLAATRDLNPNEAGEALPTMVRVFQLSSLAKADTLEPNDFWEHPAESLGSELVAQDEFMLDPGDRTSAWVVRRGATNYLFAAALFRRPTGNTWRTVIPLAPVEQSECPADAPPPRTGTPNRDDLKVLINLQRYQIEGTRVGAGR